MDVLSIHSRSRQIDEPKDRLIMAIKAPEILVVVRELPPYITLVQNHVPITDAIQAMTAPRTFIQIWVGVT